jgi:hypothetical protein
MRRVLDGPPLMVGRGPRLGQRAPHGGRRVSPRWAWVGGGLAEPRVTCLASTGQG